jgi:hypothetical protein
VALEISPDQCIGFAIEGFYERDAHRGRVLEEYCC